VRRNYCLPDSEPQNAFSAAKTDSENAVKYICSLGLNHDGTFHQREDSARLRKFFKRIIALSPLSFRQGAIAYDPGVSNRAASGGS
jgi:hypothetical protein